MVRATTDMNFFCSTFFPLKVCHTMTPDGESFIERPIGGWEARPWQIEVLKSPHRAKVLRVNRRAGKTHFLCAYILWRTCTNPRYKSLVVCPTDSQVHIIYNKILNEFIELDDKISREFKKLFYVTKHAKPREIIFRRNSIILFQTAGTRSGSKGISIRGMGADLVVLDEADYLSDDDLRAIMPIMNERTDIEVILTSTPTGRDSMYKKACERAFDWRTGRPAEKSWEEWAHFHYNCWDTMPHWTREREIGEKQILGVDGYTKEWLAEFGRETAAVFSKDDINKCAQNGSGWYSFSDKLYPTYGYPDHDPEPNVGVNILTVDWDRVQAGTTIMVSKVYLNPDNSKKFDIRYFNSHVKIRILKRIEMPIQEFAINKAEQTIIAFLDKYKVKYIYSDIGQGAELAIEQIKMHLKESKSMPPQNVILSPFNRNVAYLDTHSGEKRQMMAKQMMVMLAQAKMESNSIILNPNDTEMITQLKSYRVVKVTQSGNPVYSNTREHSVDTLMLACLAAYEQFTDLTTGATPDPNNVYIIDQASKYRIPRSGIDKRYIPDPSVPNNTGIDEETGQKRAIILKPRALTDTNRPMGVFTSRASMSRARRKSAGIFRSKYRNNRGNIWRRR